MSLIQIFLLSGDQNLCDLVLRLLPDCDITVGSCLAECLSPLTALWLIIDPRCVNDCCFERLTAWRRKVDPRRVVFLPFAGLPQTLLALPLVIPGIVAAPDQLPALFATRRPGPEAAWASRDRIFGSETRPVPVQALLVLARTHDHNSYSVREAARDLGVSVRSLRRRSMATIGFPPGIVIALARVISLAKALREPRKSLNAVARTHCFSDAAAMSRLFFRFTKLRPGAFRERIASMSETATLFWPIMAMDLQHRPRYIPANKSRLTENLP